MKTLTILKLFLLSALLVTSVHAARLSEEDKADARRQLDELIQETKGSDGLIQMDKFNVVAFQSLEEFHVNRKITREELLKFKQELEGIRVKVAPKDREAQIRTLFDKNLLAVDNSKKDLIKEGGICNHWDCAKGLKCAPVPPRVEVGSRLKSGDQFCSSDSECSSGECYEGDDGKKRCEFTYRCFRPVAEGKSCLENPVCGKGSCNEVFFSDANIGACEKNGVACKSNLDCCSDSCVKGVCAENYTCQDCIKSGKLSRGQKCCADQSFEENGKCVPIVIPVNPFVKILEQTLDVVFPSAQASEQDCSQITDSDPNMQEARRAECYSQQYGEGTPAPVSTPNTASEYSSGAQQWNNTSFVKGQGLSADQTDGAGIGQMGRLSIATNAPSNFDTCEINLVNDYAKRLRESFMGDSNVSMLEVELALLGFEYVAGGDNQIEDYWKGGEGNKSLHERVKAVAKKRTNLRAAFMDDLRWFEPKVTCLCLEKTGYKLMTEEQRKTYEETCRLGLAIPSLDGGITKKVTYNNTVGESVEADYKVFSAEDLEKYRAEREEEVAKLAMSPEQWNAHIEELKRSLAAQEVEEGADALGMKALELLEAWAAANATIEEVSLLLTNISLSDLDDVHEWMVSDAAWNNPERNTHRKNELYKFEIKNQSSFPSDPMLAIALLSAGVVAVLGGFAFASTISAWVSIGVITSAAASVGAGMWMISSLRGAWYSTSPYVQDTSTGSYKCGKSDTCSTYDRYVYQPYNTVCNKHISANACIKHFIVENSDSQNPAMVIDPWIPQGMSLTDVVKDTRDLSSLLDQGWNKAYEQMKQDIPYPSNFNSKAASSVQAWIQAGNTPQYSEDIFTTTVITNEILGKYAPALNGNAESSYVISSSLKEKIVTGAAEFLKEQGWVSSDEEANAFGNYVYKYHFIWPKTTLSDVMAYPQPGFITYIGLIADGLASNMEFSASVAGGFRQLQQSYNNEIARRGENFGLDGNRISVGGRPTEGELTAIDGNANGAGSGVGFNDFGNVSGFGSSNVAGLNNGDGLLAGSTFGNGGFDASLFGSGVNAALSNLRDFRDKQKKTAEKFKKNISKTERGKRLISKAGDFRKRFFSDSNGGAGSGGLLGAGLGGNLLSHNQNTGSASGASGSDAGLGSGSSFFSEGVYGSTGGGRNNDKDGSAAGYGFGGDYTGPYSGAAGSARRLNSGSTSGKRISGSGISVEDERRLMEAIRIRDASRDSGAYDRRDDMSLWEIVTNTYIRVYDRLLERKENSLDR